MGPLSTFNKVVVDITVVLGTTSMPIHQVLRLGRGAIIELESAEDDAVHILANNLPVAKGTVVLCQEDARASCCVRDEGRPFGAALQGEASNRQELLRPKPAVVNVLVKKGVTLITSGMDERDERKQTSDEASKVAR